MERTAFPQSSAHFPLRAKNQRPLYLVAEVPEPTCRANTKVLRPKLPFHARSLRRATPFWAIYSANATSRSPPDNCWRGPRANRTVPSPRGRGSPGFSDSMRPALLLVLLTQSFERHGEPLMSALAVNWRVKLAAPYVRAPARTPLRPSASFPCQHSNPHQRPVERRTG